MKRATLILLLLACGQSLCRGGVIIQTPVGSTAGDEFRIVFVTDGTTNATSSDISSYDAFVNAQAGGATYNGMTVNWQAIGSTATVNAVDHIGSSTAGVYLASGTEVATSTTADTGGLWSGNSLEPDRPGPYGQHADGSYLDGNGEVRSFWAHKRGPSRQQSCETRLLWSE